MKLRFGGYPTRLRRMVLGPRTPAMVWVGSGMLLIQTAEGHPMYLDAQDTSLTPSLALTGEWEPWIATALMRQIRPGMRVVDVGANCGPHALRAAHAVGPGGKVVAIDANPRMIDLMRRTFAANALHWARAIHGAVMQETGDVELGVPDEMSGSASVWIKSGEYPSTVSTISAPGGPLAQFLNGDPRVDILKIDTEGAEPLVLAGAEDVIAGNRDIKIFMEWAPAMQRGFCPPAEFLERIRTRGFHVYEIDRASRLVPRTNADLIHLDWTELLLSRTRL